MKVIETEIDRRYMMQKFILIGPGKCGKSDFLHHAENHLFLETEAGLNHLKCRKVPIRDWSEMREIAGELLQTWEAFRKEKGIESKVQMTPELQKEFLFQGKPLETVIIDTIDRAYDFAAEDSMNKGRETFKDLDIDSLFDMPKGTGWDWTRKRVKALVNFMEELPCAIWLVGHIKTEKVEPKDAKSFDRETINISGQTGDDLLKWADHTIQIRHRFAGATEVRHLSTVPSQFLDCGSRGLMVPNGMEWGPDSKKNWDTFRALFS